MKLEELRLEDLPDLDQVLAAMSEDDQAVLIPHYCFGFTLEQLAQAMGVSRSCMSQRVLRALRRTRRKLGVA